VSHLLAKAEQWHAEIDRGDVRNRSAIAGERGSQVYWGHLLDLLWLHPDSQREIRRGARDRQELAEATMISIS
jgi:hypothetical protein